MYSCVRQKSVPGSLYGGHTDLGRFACRLFRKRYEVRSASGRPSSLHIDDGSLWAKYHSLSELKKFIPEIVSAHCQKTVSFISNRLPSVCLLLRLGGKLLLKEAPAFGRLWCLRHLVSTAARMVPFNETMPPQDISDAGAPKSFIDTLRPADNVIRLFQRHLPSGSCGKPISLQLQNASDALTVKPPGKTSRA
jgi:hypothetical protein